MNNILNGAQTYVHLVVRDSCPVCSENLLKLNTLQQNDVPFKLTIINLDKGDTMPDYYGYIITPSIFINNRLWKIGSVKESEIFKKLNP
ncbi:MAG: hypothetical protein ACE5D0_05780 [Fidelibacterota bacterium]